MILMFYYSADVMWWL